MSRHDQGQGSASGGSSISSEEELRKARAAIQEYERRKAEVRRVLRDVLATECVSQDGLLIEMLSEGYRERTGEEAEIVMVSDFLSEIADQLSLPAKPMRKPKNPGRSPRPVAIVRAGGREQKISGGWAAAFRLIAQEVVDDNPGREDIWRSLQFARPKRLLPDYLKKVASNVEVAPGLWLNTHGDPQALKKYMRTMLDAFDHPKNRWRFRLDDGTMWKI